MRIVEASNVAIMVTIRKVLEEEGIDKSLAVSLRVLRALQASGVQHFPYQRRLASEGNSREQFSGYSLPILGGQIMFDRVAETGIRKCVICGRFLPRFIFEECVCSCGAYYAMRESL